MPYAVGQGWRTKVVLRGQIDRYEIEDPKNPKIFKVPRKFFFWGFKGHKSKLGPDEGPQGQQLVPWRCKKKSLPANFDPFYLH